MSWHEAPEYMRFVVTLVAMLGGIGLLALLAAVLAWLW